MRHFSVTDEGTDFQLAMYVNQEQIGNAMFLDDGSGHAFDLAQELGRLWVRSGEESAAGERLAKSGSGVSPL